MHCPTFPSFTLVLESSKRDSLAFPDYYRTTRLETYGPYFRSSEPVQDLMVGSKLHILPETHCLLLRKLLIIVAAKVLNLRLGLAWHVQLLVSPFLCSLTGQPNILEDHDAELDEIGPNGKPGFGDSELAQSRPKTQGQKMLVWFEVCGVAFWVSLLNLLVFSP